MLENPFEEQISELEEILGEEQEIVKLNEDGLSVSLSIGKDDTPPEYEGPTSFNLIYSVPKLQEDPKGYLEEQVGVHTELEDYFSKTDESLRKHLANIRPGNLIIAIFKAAFVKMIPYFKRFKEPEIQAAKEEVATDKLLEKAAEQAQDFYKDLLSSEGYLGDDYHGTFARYSGEEMEEIRGNYNSLVQSTRKIKCSLTRIRTTDEMVLAVKMMY